MYDYDLSRKIFERFPLEVFACNTGKMVLFKRIPSFWVRDCEYLLRLNSLHQFDMCIMTRGVTPITY